MQKLFFQGRDDKVVITVKFNEPDYRIRFPRSFVEKVAGWDYITEGNMIKFSPTYFSNKRVNVRAGTIGNLKYIRHLFKLFDIEWGESHFMTNLKVVENDGIIKAILTPEQPNVQYDHSSPIPTLFIEPDEPEFEPQEDVLERVKNDILSLRKMGVKCSFSYETTKVVTETI